MCNNEGKDIHMQIGAMASKIPVLEHLRYCPKCVEEEIKKVGQPYWHRSHNVEGVFYCYKHKVLLSERDSVNELYVHSKSKRELISLKRAIAQGSKLDGRIPIKELNLTPRERQLLMDIAYSTWKVMNYDFYKTSVNSTQMYKLYYHKLEEKQLLINGTRINLIHLKAELHMYYGSRVLALLNLEFDKDDQGIWVKTFFDKKKKANHSIKHIVMLNWLYDGDIDRFLEDTRQGYKSIDETYWPCLNPAANHYKARVIRGYKISYNCKLKYHIATFTCECGFIYTRKLDELYNLNKISRVKEYGDVWKKKMLQYIVQDNMSIQKAADLLKVHRTTVESYIKKLGLKTDNIGIECSNNKEKLEKISIPKRTDSIKVQQRKRHNRVNWEERDIKISEKVLAEIERLKTGERCVRITISCIGKNIGLLNMLEKHRDKLPITKAILEENVESISEYKIRKFDKRFNK